MNLHIPGCIASCLPSALAMAFLPVIAAASSPANDGKEFLVNRFVFAHGAPYKLPGWEKQEKWYEFRVDTRIEKPATNAALDFREDVVAVTVPDPGQTWKAGYIIGPRKIYEGDRIEITVEDSGLAAGDLSFELVFREGVPHGWKKNHIVTVPAAELRMPTGVPGSADGQRYRAVAYSIGEAQRGFYLNELRILFSPSSAAGNTLRLHGLSIWRQPVDNRLDADAILENPPVNEACVALHNGVMNVLLNGEPINFMAYESMLPQQFGNYDAQLNQGGFGITRFGIVLGEDVYLRFHPPTWVGPRQYDFTWLDQKLGELLALKPDNKVVLAVIFDGADWWTNLHPDSAGVHAHTAHATGKYGAVAEGDRNSAAGYSYPGIPDYLSEEWKRDAREAVRQMVAHIQSSAWGQAVIGYELFGGLTMDCNFEVNDSTPKALERFRAMLRENYRTDAALRQAWGRSDVTFVTAVPEHLVTGRNPLPTLKTPLVPDLAGRQAYLDSKRFREIVFQEIILNFGRWIKEATHGRALVGARTGNFMGHLWSWGEKQEMRENRNNPIDLLSKSPDFDFFDVQEPYVGRHNLGFQGTGFPVSAIQGLAADGKLLVIQDDVPHEVSPRTLRNDERYLTGIKRRVFINCLVSGSIPYQWEMGHYQFAHRYLLKEFRQQQAVMDRAVRLPRHSEAEVAFVFDRGWQKYLGLDDLQDRPTRMIAFMDLAKWTWNRAGVPVDTIFIDQLPAARPYKLYVFFNTFGITPEQADIIRETVQRDNRVALFTWADGYSTARGHDAAWMSQVTGMKITASDASRAWRMSPAPALAGKVTVSDDFPLGVLTRTAPGETTAADWTYTPSFTVTDPLATPLATYSNSKDVGAAIRKQGDWTSLYTASPILSPALLRYAAKEAGVHSWTTTEDALYVNRSFVGLHAKDTGRIALTLPTPSPLFEVFDQTEHPAAATHTIEVEAGRSYLFFRGTKAGWENVRTR
ncbi:hypothetical protein OPIT5_10195 [Opitutaceae bacterium TAV5]|nr:hypothetical protein OPIT5_10195 [Opitutaceae bacterium TAV5]